MLVQLTTKMYLSHIKKDDLGVKIHFKGEVSPNNNVDWVGRKQF